MAAMSPVHEFEVIVIGGGHAGVEAAWAAANLGARTALVTMDPTKIGAMSCNPAIGGLAKGQMVREIDALGGLMARAADATGIQFRVLNATKGQAVHGPRCQSDKYRYARWVQQLIGDRAMIDVIAGAVVDLHLEAGRCVGVKIKTSGSPPNPAGHMDECPVNGQSRSDGRTGQMNLRSGAVVLTTGTFMRGLMHTGDRKSEGGRVGERPVYGMSDTLRRLGLELGRLKTGTPPRLAAESIRFDDLEIQSGDAEPVPFSDMTSRDRFPEMEQRCCWITQTDRRAHDLIRSNLHRAPMYNGQIDPGNVGPRYCPSIEDKVVRFADRDSHHVYLEPESLDTNEIYCNGISTSLPADVQAAVVRQMPGCEEAGILRYGYAVEYDMVWPHQIEATCMSKKVEGLFLAGQINGTSGYEEAAGQGLIAGLNAVRYARGLEQLILRRDQAYIGVMMDDLVTKTPREPYRMFTSRAEFRLMLRADNAATRLTPLGRQLGLVDDKRWAAFAAREAAAQALVAHLRRTVHDGQRLVDWLRRPEVDASWVLDRVNGEPLPPLARESRVIGGVLADVKYAGYIDRQSRQIRQFASQESRRLPTDLAYDRVTGLRNEARHVLEKFRPSTLGQAARLSGVNPADLMLISVMLERAR